jgi:hypothetical protein
MTRRSTLLTAAATATGVIVGLTSPAAAHAYPCGQWAFSGPTTLRQSNGWRLYFDSTSPRALGAAEAVSRGGHMKGTIEGGITGNKVTLVARWTSGPIGKYEGQVDPDGNITGITYDATNPSSTASWSSDQRASCLSPA